MDANQISVSIIIPMRNEEKFVSKCLDSLLSQIQGRNNFEIFCIDGMSVDKTAEIIQQYARKDNRIRLIENPLKIVSAAMNLGIGQSRGDFIMIVGCHAEYAPDYIDKCLEVFKRTGADQVGGYFTTLPSKDTAVGRAIAAVTSSRFGVGSGQRVTGPEREANVTAFGGFRRDVFDRFGLYDERLVRNQDIELFNRIHRNGGKIIISPKIRIKYYNRSTFSGLANQAFLNGLWNPYTVWLTHGGMNLKHFVPLIFLLSIIMLCLAGFLWWPAWVVLGCELLAYITIAWVNAFRLAGEARTSTVLIFLAFVQLHFIYGIGSLWGVLTAPFKFGFRFKQEVGKALQYQRE
jgi:glycosyltransferase involved in cell wall biosynthesis